MSTDYRWEEIETLLDEALEYPPEERAGWLLEACGDDIELRREVDQMLAVRERAEGLLERSIDTLASSALADLEGERETDE